VAMSHARVFGVTQYKNTSRRSAIKRVRTENKVFVRLFLE
jgi:hypothetical protein